MAAPTRPAYLQAPNIGLVLVGGAIGAGSREGLSLGVPDLDGVPVVITVVNVVGAFILGYLYEALTRTDPGPARTSQLKLLLGTGFCGGFTTYSSLATDTAVLIDHTRWGMALAYALGTVLIGAGATIAGIAVAVKVHESHGAPGQHQT